MRATVTPALVLVTDPMCSWCWGMWPEFRKLQQRFADRVGFELVLCGMQVGDALEPPDDAARARLGEIWAEVARVSGQPIRGRLPEDPAFFYHSELPCRALGAARELTGAVPFDFLEQLHIAFYVEGVNITSPAQLAQQDSYVGLDRDAFMAAFRDDAVKQATRRQFAVGQRLCGGIMPSLVGVEDAAATLLSGGYATCDGLSEVIERWLAGTGTPAHPEGND